MTARTFMQSRKGSCREQQDLPPIVRPALWLLCKETREVVEWRLKKSLWK